MLNVLLLIFAIFLIGMMIPYLLAQSILGPVFRLFVVPGVILHELAHAGVCLITGTKIHRIRVFKRTGGEVAHEQSKIPIIGPLLITMAPIMAGLLALVWLGSRIIDTSAVKLGTSINDFGPFLMSVIRSAHWQSATAVLWIYLILAIGATMTPSFQDLKNSALSFVIIAAAIIAIFKTGFLETQLTQLAVSITPALTLVLFIMLLVWCLAMLIYLLSGIFGINR
ncbi:MAG: hypothetical protein WC773_00745 [Patescibacteria group bacterium]|jgi:hypothetical protein